MDWDSAQDALLRQLRDQGCSFGVIFKEFAARGFARTKSALVGRASRQHFPGPTKPSTKVKKRYHNGSGAVSALLRLRSRPAASVTPTTLEAAGVFLGLELLELGKEQCRYPQGDGEEIRFCGQPSWHDCPYCLKHRNICYIGVSK